MRTIKEINEEIDKLIAERRKVVEEDIKNKISNYRKSIDFNKAEEFYKEYNNLCDKYGMSIGETSYDNGGYYWSIINSYGQTVCMINKGKLKELTDEQIEDVVS